MGRKKIDAQMKVKIVGDHSCAGKVGTTVEKSLDKWRVRLDRDWGCFCSERQLEPVKESK